MARIDEIDARLKGTAEAKQDLEKIRENDTDLGDVKFNKQSLRNGTHSLADAMRGLSSVQLPDSVVNSQAQVMQSLIERGEKTGSIPAESANWIIKVLGKNSAQSLVRLRGLLEKSKATVSAPPKSGAPETQTRAQMNDDAKFFKMINKIAKTKKENQALDDVTMQALPDAGAGVDQSQLNELVDGIKKYVRKSASLTAKDARALTANDTNEALDKDVLWGDKESNTYLTGVFADHMERVFPGKSKKVLDAFYADASRERAEAEATLKEEAKVSESAQSSTQKEESGNSIAGSNEGEEGGGLDLRAIHDADGNMTTIADEPVFFGDGKNGEGLLEQDEHSGYDRVKREMASAEAYDNNRAVNWMSTHEIAKHRGVPLADMLDELKATKKGKEIVAKGGSVKEVNDAVLKLADTHGIVASEATNDSEIIGEGDLHMMKTGWYKNTIANGKSTLTREAVAVVPKDGTAIKVDGLEKGDNHFDASRIVSWMGRTSRGGKAKEYTEGDDVNGSMYRTARLFADGVAGIAAKLKVGVLMSGDKAVAGKEYMHVPDSTVVVKANKEEGKTAVTWGELKNYLTDGGKNPEVQRTLAPLREQRDALIRELKDDLDYSEKMPLIRSLLKTTRAIAKIRKDEGMEEGNEAIYNQMERNIKSNAAAKGRHADTDTTGFSPAQTVAHKAMRAKIIADHEADITKLEKALSDLTDGLDQEPDTRAQMLKDFKELSDALLLLDEADIKTNDLVKQLDALEVRLDEGEGIPTLVQEMMGVTDLAKEGLIHLLEAKYGEDVPQLNMDGSGNAISYATKAAKRAKGEQVVNSFVKRAKETKYVKEERVSSAVMSVIPKIKPAISKSSHAAATNKKMMESALAERTKSKRHDPAAVTKENTSRTEFAHEVASAHQINDRVRAVLERAKTEQNRIYLANLVDRANQIMMERERTEAKMMDAIRNGDMGKAAKLFSQMTGHLGDLESLAPKRGNMKHTADQVARAVFAADTTFEDYVSSFAPNKSGMKFSMMSTNIHEDLEQRGFAATHDSPIRHDGKFDWRKHAMRGEGAMVYGAGTYLSTSDSVHRWYKTGFSGKSKKTGFIGNFIEDANKVDPHMQMLDNLVNILDDARSHIGDSNTNKMIESFITAFNKAIPSERKMLGDSYEQAYVEKSKMSPFSAEDIDTFTGDVRRFMVEFNDALAGKVADKFIPEKSPTYHLSVDIKNKELLDWDTPFSEQSELVQRALEKSSMFKDLKYKKKLDDPTGKDIYKYLSHHLPKGKNGDRGASEFLQRLGILGHRFAAEGGKDDTHPNFVIYDDSKINTNHVSFSKSKNNDAKKYHAIKQAVDKQKAALGRVNAELDELNKNNGQKEAIDGKKKFVQLLEELIEKTEAELAATPDNGRITQKEIDDNLAYFAKVFGHSIPKVEHGEYTDFAGAFKEALNDPVTGKEMQKATILVSVYSKDPTGVRYHEALHAWFAALRKNGDHKVIKEFLSFARSPEIMSQLRTLLKDEPAALKQISEDHEEAAAYAFQFWNALNADGSRVLKLSAKPTGILNQIKEVLQRYFGIWTASERAEKIMEYFNSGEYAANIEDRGAVHRALVAKGRNGTIEHMRKGTEMAVKVTQAMLGIGSARIRDFGIPSYTEIVDLISRHTTDTGEDRGYLNAVGVGVRNLMNDVMAGLEKFDEDDIKAAFNQMQSKTDVGEYTEIKAVLRKFFDERMDALKAAKISLGFIEDYVPVLWDPRYIAGHQDEFIAMLQKAKGMGRLVDAGTPEEIMARLMSDDGAEIGIDAKIPKSKASPGMQQLKTRFLDIDDADRAPFLHQDYLHTITSYARQSTRRIEWKNRFGDDGAKMEALIARGKKEGATEEEEATLRKYIAGVDGSLGSDISPNARKYMATAMVFSNVRMLGLGWFSSLLDAGGIKVNGGEWSDALNAYKLGVSQMLRGLMSNPNPNAAIEFAEDIGAIERASLVSASMSANNYNTVTGATRTVNDALFRVNLMEQQTKNMRAGASVAAARFIARQVGEGAGKHSERWLAELGLTKDDVKLDANGKLLVFRDEVGGDVAYEAKMKMALNTWIDGAIVRPDQAKKALWMNDPLWVLVAHMKTYTFAFHDTILKKVLHESDYGNYGPAYALLSYVPLAIAAAAAKSMVQGGGGDVPEWQKGWGFGDYLWSGITKSGITGTGQFAIDEAKGIASHNYLNALGPTASFVEHTIGSINKVGGATQFINSVIPTSPLDSLLKLDAAKASRAR
jgi:hypothetical protein